MDDLTRTLAQVCEWDIGAMTPRGADWLFDAAAELRNIGATPPELLKRGRRYKARYETAPTPTAMSRHYASLAGPPPPPTGDPCVDGHRTAETPDGLYCVRCRGWVSMQLMLSGAERPEAHAD